MVVTTGDSVTIEYTGRTTDGAVFDTSREAVAAETGLAEAQPDRDYEPLTFEVGAGRVIEGLEAAIVGLEAGTTETITIPPEEAYGEWSDQQVQSFEPEALREMLGEVPSEGDRLQAQDGTQGEVIAVDETAVDVDFNSPLAGETLEFEIEVVAVA